MAGSHFRVVRGNAPTTATTQDFTSSGFGTPDAALFYVSWKHTSTGAINHTVFGMGMTDGSTHYSCGFNSRHAQATAQTHSRGQDDPIILMRTNNETNFGYATFDSFITDGVRIDWSSDPPPNAVTVTCVLIKADNAKVIKVTNTGTEDATLNVTGLGFTPSFAWAMTNAPSVDTVSAGGTGAADARLCMGLVKWTVADTCQQASMSYGEDDGVADGNPFAHLANDRGIVTLTDESTIGTELQFSNRDSDGFDVITRNGSNSFDTFMLCIELGGDLDNSLGIHTGPTSTGDWDITSYSFEPTFLHLLHTGVTTVNSLEANNAEAGIGGVYVADDTTQGTTGWVTEDGSATTDTGSISHTSFYQLEDDGTSGYTATFSSFNSDGFTLNFSVAVPTTGPIFLAWAIKEPSATAEETLTSVTSEADQGDITQDKAREMTLTGVDVDGAQGDLGQTRARDMTLTGVTAVGAQGDIAISGKTRSDDLTQVSAVAAQSDITQAQAINLGSVMAVADEGDIVESRARDLNVGSVSAVATQGDVGNDPDTTAEETLGSVSAVATQNDITTELGREMALGQVLATSTQNDIFLRQAQALGSISAVAAQGDITQGLGEYEYITALYARASQGDITQAQSISLEGVSAVSSQGDISTGQVALLEAVQAIATQESISLAASRSLETLVSEVAVWDVQANGVVAVTPLQAISTQGDIRQAQAIDIEPVGAVVTLTDIVNPQAGVTHQIAAVRAVVSLGSFVDYEFFVSNAQRIYKTLYSLIDEGPFYQVNYDTDGEQSVVLPAVHVKPGSIMLNEVDAEFGDSRNKQTLRFAKTIWAWVAYIDFHVPVVVDAFEEKLLKNPVNIPRDNNNVLDPVIVEFNRATYQHGSLQGPEAGTHYELSFFATPLEG